MAMTTAPRLAGARSRARLHRAILTFVPADATGPGPAPGVAGQAIVDATGRTVGVELLYRHPPATGAPLLVSEADHEHATTTVVDLAMRDVDPAGRGLLFLNTPRAFLVGQQPLPPADGRVVVEVLEGVAADGEVVAGVLELLAQGYRIALDDWVGGDDRAALLGLVQFVKIDLDEVTRERLPAVVAQARAANPDVHVVVERIETADDLQVAVEAGADLFQGYLLATPDPV